MASSPLGQPAAAAHYVPTSKSTALRTPYSLGRDEGSVHNLGVDFVIKVSEFTSGAGASVAEYVTRKGEEPQDHVHQYEDEMFYVLEGKVAFRCAGSRFEVDRGGLVFLPKGIRHGYDILSDGDVRLLVITAPPRDKAGGWAAFWATSNIAEPLGP